jgi:hypothetical protein
VDGVFRPTEIIFASVGSPGCCPRPRRNRLGCGGEHAPRSLLNGGRSPQAIVGSSAHRTRSSSLPSEKQFNSGFVGLPSGYEALLVLLAYLPYRCAKYRTASAITMKTKICAIVTKFTTSPRCPFSGRARESTYGRRGKLVVLGTKPYGLVPLVSDRARCPVAPARAPEPAIAPAPAPAH